MRRDAHIEPKPNDLRLLPDLVKAHECSVDMMARTSLIANVMQRSGEDAITHYQLDRISGILNQGREAPRVPERGAKLSVIELINAQAPKGA
jgi:hypothetical protein